MERRPILVELAASSAAVSAAHDARVHEAIAGVEWERRGLLQRLKRSA